MARLKTDLTPEDRELILALANERNNLIRQKRQLLTELESVDKELKKLKIQAIAEKFGRTRQRIGMIISEMRNANQ